MELDSKESRRKTIIDAAIGVFAKRGFFKTRVSDLAEAAGIADGTIYLYFRNKNEILIAIFEEKMGEFLRVLEERLAKCESPVAKLRDYVLYHFTLVAENPELMQVLTIEIRQSPRFLTSYHPREFSRYLQILQGILEEGQTAGVFTNTSNPRIFRRALFGAIDELSREWLLQSDKAAPLNPVEMADALSDFLIRGLQPCEGA